ncbi:cAMP-activated global transcriptional regulator CRP [compost metagenome]
MKPATHQAIDDFFAKYPVRHYKKGHILILAGEKAPSAFFLTEGKVRVYDITYRGEEIIINSLHPSAFFPLSLIMNSSTTRYIYEATTDITVRQAPVDDAMHFLTTHPPVVLDLLSQLYVTLDNVLERMVHFISSSAKNRIIYSLIAECKQSGELRDDGSYIVAITEKELGSRAGLSRETVSREARVLKIAKLIEVHHSTVTIPNLKRLQRYLEIHN